MSAKSENTFSHELKMCKELKGNTLMNPKLNVDFENKKS